MKNLRWANPEKKGICYDMDNGIIVYLDSGEQYSQILASGQYIAESSVSSGIPAGPDDVIEIEPKTKTRLEFLDLFTSEEWIAVLTAKKTNVELEMWYDRLLAADYVDFADARLIAGLDALVSAGLITEERMAEIINA